MERIKMEVCSKKTRFKFNETFKERFRRSFSTFHSRRRPDPDLDRIL